MKLGGEVVRSPRSTVGMAFQKPGFAGVAHDPAKCASSARDRQQFAHPESKNRTGRGNFCRWWVSKVLKTRNLQNFPVACASVRRSAGALVHRPSVLILDGTLRRAGCVYPVKNLWQIMHELRHQEEFTCLLITHDLRESVFLANEVVVLSGRPATTQYVLDVFARR